VGVKEVKVRPQITDNDLGLKVRNMRRFLDEGHKAKVTMFFRGREIIRPELGMKVFERITQTLTGKFTWSSRPGSKSHHHGCCTEVVVSVPADNLTHY
jgi:translation initiation factor IF-3